MSLHRRAAKRDAAEPGIVKTLEAHGCIVWRLSGKGLTDLVVFQPKTRWPDGTYHRRILVADVKGPKEKATPAQEEKWGALTALGFSVFILRTPEDAVKMLNNALQPWEPATPRIGNDGRLILADLKGNARMVEVARRMRANEPVYGNTPRKGDAAKRHRCGKNGCRNLRPCVDHDGTMKRTTMEATENYTPPRSKPVDAATPKGMGMHIHDQDPKWLKERIERSVDAAKEAEVFAPADDGHKPCARDGCRKRVLGSDTCMEHDPDPAWESPPPTQCACRLGSLCSYHKRRP